MAKIFIADIQPNQDVATSLVVAEKQLRTASNGKPYLTLKLVDKTGVITGRIWERAVEIDSEISTKAAARLKGKSEKYKDDLQINIREIEPTPLDEVDPSDYLPVCPLSIESLVDQLRKIVSGIGNRPFYQLLKQIFGDKEILERFKLAPAAKVMHHAYLGGLLEHSVAVARLVAHITEDYPDLDRDLLVTGAVLHDIGKIEEFSYDLCIDYSDAGRLLGHITLGVQIVEEKIRAMKSFPAEQGLLLKHLILSHHGTTEFGSPKLPMTKEAFVLHFADDLDAKMNTLSRLFAECEASGSTWSCYQSAYARQFFKGFATAYDDEEDASSPAPADEQGVQLSIWNAAKKARPEG